LVVNLAQSGAAAVVASDVAQPLDPGADSLTKKWVVLGRRRAGTGSILAREGCDFVRERYRK
jgi:hypothetical protein